MGAGGVQVGILATDSQHGARGGGTQHTAVVASGANGFMLGVDKAKLDGISGVFGNSYQQVNDPTRTTLTGAGSTSYPPAGGATKITMTTPALAAGTYRLSWSAIIDYSSAARDMNIRMQDTTDTVTLNECVFRPTNATERMTYAGQALIAFAGIAKTLALQFHTANTGDTAGIAFAYMDLFRVS